MAREVIIDLSRDGGETALTHAEVQVQWTPTRVRTTPATMVLPMGVPKQVITGPTTFEVEETGVDWAYYVQFTAIKGPKSNGGQWSFTVQVPPGEAILFHDLPQIDPTTLDPVVEPEAAWWAAIENIRGPEGPAGPQGLPGVNAVPAVEAVATYIESDTPVRTALNAAIGEWAPAKTVAAGERVIAPTGEQVVARAAHTTGAVYDASLYRGIPASVPTMTIYPQRSEPLRKVLYQHDADTMYAVAQSAPFLLYKTTNAGTIWTNLGDVGMDLLNLIQVDGTGTLIATELTSRGEAGLNPRVIRSTDGGKTWTVVKTLQFPGLGRQSSISPAPGVVLIGEYGNVGLTSFRVMRSTDDGLTWTPVLSSPGTDGVWDPGHFHSIVKDPVGGALLTFMDRDHPDLYRSDDHGATWTKIGTSSKNHHPNWVAPMFFKDHIVWGNDNQADGRVYRLTRADFYAGRWDNAETVAFLNNDRFYDTFPILPDTWVMVGATEVVDLNRPGSWGQEVFIVTGEGTIVSGGLEHISPQVRMTTAMGHKSQLPGYPATPPDMKGRSVISLNQSNRPAHVATVPYTVGYGPARPVTNNASIADHLFARGAGLVWRDHSMDGVGDRRVLHMDTSGRVNLSNEDTFLRQLTGGTTMLVRVMPDGTEKNLFAFRDGNTSFYGSTVYLNSGAAGPSITFSDGSPEGVVFAELGSVHLEKNGATIWVRRVGADRANTGWRPVNMAESTNLAGLGMATAQINTRGKQPGREVFLTDVRRPVWSIGSMPTSAWYYADGTLAVTPA